jgi:hypothetical protein
MTRQREITPTGMRRTRWRDQHDQRAQHDRHNQHDHRGEETP